MSDMVAELKRKLPKQVNRNTLMVAPERLEKSNKIGDSERHYPELKPEFEKSRIKRPYEA